MATITTRDGAEIYFRDWGSGEPVVFSHGWALSADAWENQMLCLASEGFRCIAFDRRGHGRSSQPWNGNDMDTYADDLAELVTALDLGPAVHVGHCAGGGEVARYVGRHGTRRISKVVLIGAVPPLMIRTDANPDGLPASTFDEMRSGLIEDRAQFFEELSSRFYGLDRLGARVSQGLRHALWMQGMMGGLKSELDGVRAFSETDFTEDLIRLDRPTLILHGDGDQFVPVDVSAKRSAKLVPNAILDVYADADHGLCSTAKDRVNADILRFLQAKL